MRSDRRRSIRATIANPVGDVGYSLLVLQTTWSNVKNGGFDPRDDSMIYVGAGSIWSNPFRNRRDMTRNQKIEAFGWYLLATPELLWRLPELRGKSLWCYCSPANCHAEILAHLADSGWWEKAI